MSDPVPTVEFDHQAPGFNVDPYPVYAELRSKCPMARSEAHEGFWIASTYQAISDVIHRPAEFSSKIVTVPKIQGVGDIGLPPLNLDPPDHGPLKRVLASAFLPQRVERLLPVTHEIVADLLDKLVPTGGFDASHDFSRLVPLTLMARLLDLPLEDEAKFTDWVLRTIDMAGDLTSSFEAAFELVQYFGELVPQRVGSGADDLISFLHVTEVDGRRLEGWEIGLCSITLLLAGIDTTWSALAATIHYLAGHPDDQRRLREEPALWETAREEFLRVFAPVTVARLATADTEVLGCPVAAEEMVLLPFPSANRDEAEFPDAEQVRLDRSPNRHLTFGLGIHRCIGATLARMEMDVALGEFLRRIPDFRLAEGGVVEWSTGQIRGPRKVPIVFGPGAPA